MLVMHSKPYCNPQIIQAIRDLYFTGGNTSFCMQFDQFFPCHTSDDGVIAREVPIPMVALVATAVSAQFLYAHEHTNPNYQLYASIYEWRTGVQQPMEFSGNTYFGVYQAHVTSLEI